MKPRTTATAAMAIRKSDIKEIRNHSPVRFSLLDYRCCPRVRGFPAYSQNCLLSISAGFGVGFKHFSNRLQLPGIRCRNRVLDDPGNIVERDTTFEKRPYRNFIGGIERDR